jgi:hypothetical protein
MNDSARMMVIIVCTVIILSVLGGIIARLYGVD